MTKQEFVQNAISGALRELGLEKSAKQTSITDKTLAVILTFPEDAVLDLGSVKEAFARVSVPVILLCGMEVITVQGAEPCDKPITEVK